MFLTKIIEIKGMGLRGLKKNVPLSSLKSKTKKANHSFLRAIKSKKPSLIAEIKSTSPSQGKIRGSFDFEKVAKEYGRSDVQAISVLTEKIYFGGSIGLIDKIKKITHKPILRKDFIIDEYQIYESRHHGADAVLLIAEILSLKKINRFIKIAGSLGMDVIVESHKKSALIKALKSNAKIIGINNRDLDTLEINKRTVQKLSKFIHKEKILIAESGIESSLDIRLLPSNAQSVLIGTSIMRSTDIRKKINELTSRKTIVKICGNTNVNDAKAALGYGADLLGFIINVPSSADNLAVNQAKKIIAPVDAKGRIVAVTKTRNVKEIMKICREVSPDVVQLHDYISLAKLKRIRNKFPNILVMKTIQVEDRNAIKKAMEYSKHADILLLDSKKGGSGIVHDWNISKEIVSKCKIPVLLAGGLNPENVAKAIKTVKPFGVDVNSGVRMRPRVKDHGKIRNFIKIAKK